MVRAHIGDISLGPRTHMELGDAGDNCHWCGKPALHREIVARAWPRTYIGGCKAHMGELTRKRVARLARISASHDAKGDLLRRCIDQNVKRRGLK